MLLKVENLQASYNKKIIVSNVNIDIEAGTVNIIVGPNGCGKSTLLKNISRLHRPDHGQVLLNTHDIWQQKPSQVAKMLALLPQTPSAPDGLTVFNLVQYGRHPYQGLFQQWSQEDEHIVNQAMAATHVNHLSNMPLQSLSGGQRQRAWIAMTLAQQTPLVLLDEPTSALDIGHQVEILKLIKNLAQQGQTFIIVLHDLFTAARYADQLIAMREGEVLSKGHPKKILNPDLVKSLYDIETDILLAPTDNTPLLIPKP